MSALRAALALLAALVLAGCDNHKEPVFQGWVEAELIFVGPDETGRIETLTVREGDPVEQRQLLFTVDTDLQAADVAMQEAGVKNAQQAFDRAQQLLKTQSGTQKTYDDADAALRTAQARLNSSQTRLTRRKVFSPVEGTVEQIYYRVGEMVPAGRPVVALLPPENIKVRAFVPESRVGTLHPGDAAQVRVDGVSEPLVGRISYISPKAEYTPPVIYSQGSREKLVFMVETVFDPGTAARLNPGQPVDVYVGADHAR
jgi:HlyD family secretion protein